MFVKNYLLLIRFYNQIGTILLFIPCLLGLMLSNAVSIKFCLVFFICSFFARSCGCILNDVADAKIDAKISTTKNRVISSNVLTKKQSLFFLLFLIILGSPFLLFFSKHIFLPLLTAGAFVIIYPFTKRFFPIPQLFLGIAYASGFIVSICNSFQIPFYMLSFNIWILYFGIVLWIIFFDTIYAKRDFFEDKIYDIKSSAILFDKKTKTCITIVLIFSIIFLFGLFTIFLGFILIPIIIGLFYNQYFLKHVEFKRINAVLLFLCFLEILTFSIWTQKWYDYIFLTMITAMQVFSLFLKSQNGFRIHSITLLPLLLIF